MEKEIDPRRMFTVTYNQQEVQGACTKEGPCTNFCANVNICPYYWTHQKTCKRTCYRKRCLNCEHMVRTD